MNEPQLSELLHRLGGEGAPVDVAAIAAGAERRRRRQRALATAAAVIVVAGLASVTVATLDGGGRVVETASRAPESGVADRSVGLADDGTVWPSAAGRSADAAAMAARFATDVLGWRDADVTLDSPAHAGPVGMTIADRSGGPTVRALAVPVAGGWAFLQIGEGVGLQSNGDGESTLEVVAGADARVLRWWVKLADGREITGRTETTNTRATSRMFARVPAAATSVRSAVVVATSATGSVVAVAGGSFASNPPPIASPRDAGS